MLNLSQTIANCCSRLVSTPLSMRELLYETGLFTQKLKHTLITALKKKNKTEVATQSCAPFIS